GLDTLGIGFCSHNGTDNNGREVITDCDCENLPGGCSEYTCGLLGSECYFVENPSENTVVNKYQCTNQELLGCESYQTQDQCEGGINSVIDVTWSSGKRVSGTNEITTRSGDLLGFGTCYWKEDSCVKDADYSRTA